jgi:hypothetical protein
MSQNGKDREENPFREERDDARKTKDSSKENRKQTWHRKDQAQEKKDKRVGKSVQIRHKKERTEEDTSMKVGAVRDGKKDKPTREALKVGKKGGTQKRWFFKVLAVKTSEDAEEPIQRILEQKKVEKKEFSTCLQSKERETKIKQLQKAQGCSI